MDPTGCTCTGIYTGTSETSWTSVEQCVGQVKIFCFYRMDGRRQGREEERGGVAQGGHFRRGVGKHDMMEVMELIY